MGPIGCPKTLVRNYHYSLRNNPEQRSSQHPYRMYAVSPLQQLTVLILLLGNLVSEKEKVAHLKTRKCVLWKLGLSVMGKVCVNYTQRNVLKID